MIQKRYKGIVMPRQSRIVLPGHPAHIIQRGNNYKSKVIFLFVVIGTR